MFAKHIVIEGTVYACNIQLKAEACYNPRPCYREDAWFTVYMLDMPHFQLFMDWMKRFDFALYGIDDQYYPERRIVFRRYVDKQHADPMYYGLLEQLRWR